jgi:hypothetical protein
MNEKGQMMILETIFFAATVTLSLVFFYQLSPSSTVSNTYVYDLTIAGDDALNTIYDDVLEVRPEGYPSSTLVHYIITNAYLDLVSELNSLLPLNTMYNVYISDGSDSVFWCNYFGEHTPLPKNDPVSSSCCVVAMDLNHLSTAAENAGLVEYDETTRFSGHNSCDLLHNSMFDDTNKVVFKIILELWYV